MKSKRTILLAVAAVVLIGSFFLPNMAAGFMDARRLDNLILVEAQSISIDAAPVLSLPERIALASSPNTEVLPLATGQAMDEQTAQATAIQEVSRFFRDDTFVFAVYECAIDNASAAFVIDTQTPSANTIIWEFVIYDREGTELIVTLDDQTGMILKMIYRGTGGDAELGEDSPHMTSDEMQRTAQNLTDMMAVYYGFPVRLGDYQISAGGNIAYYRADLSGAGTVISMYGVIRATGFTMNERV